MLAGVVDRREAIDVLRAHAAQGIGAILGQHAEGEASGDERQAQHHAGPADAAMVRSAAACA